MKIGEFEDRIAVEFNHKCGLVWVKMLDDFGVISGSDDEMRFVEGLRRGALRNLDEIKRWLETPNVIVGDKE